MSKLRFDQRGQMTIEAVLIMTVLLGIVTAASAQFRSKNVMQTLAAGPWQYVRGMIECGIWDKTLANPHHPNAKTRHLTPIGDDK